MKILIALNLDSPWDGLPEDVEPIFCGASTEEIDAHMDPTVEVLLTDALPSALNRCSGLRWIQLASANTSQLMHHPLVSKDILLSNASGVSAAHAAEYILGCILHHSKRFREFKVLQQKHVWAADRPAMACPILRMQEVIIVGYGAIGRETARLLHACGAHIIAVTRTGQRTPFRGYLPHEGMGDPQALLPDMVVATKELPSVITNADFLVLAVPLNSSTDGLVDKKMLSLMKKSAVLINISRGRVVRSVELQQALDHGLLSHAYLDVFDKEPLPSNSPLWDNPKITITPHMAGVVDDQGKKYRDLLLINLARYRKGQSLLNALDRTAFLKKLVQQVSEADR